MRRLRTEELEFTEAEIIDALSDYAKRRGRLENTDNLLAANIVSLRPGGAYKALLRVQREVTCD